MERGHRGGTSRGLGTENLFRVAAALAVRPEWLLTGSGAMEDVAASDPYPRRALAVRIAREGGIAERAIEVVAQLRVVDAERKTTLWWIEAMRAREAIIAQEHDVSPAPPIRIARRK